MNESDILADIRGKRFRVREHNGAWLVEEENDVLAATLCVPMHRNAALLVCAALNFAALTPKECMAAQYAWAKGLLSDMVEYADHNPGAHDVFAVHEPAIRAFMGKGMPTPANTSEPDNCVVFCDCVGSCTALVLQRDPEFDFIDLALYHRGHERPDWRYRLRLIWRILRTGTPYGDEMSLSKDDAVRLAFWLNHGEQHP